MPMQLTTKRVAHLERAMREGCLVRSFLSGGGLRVIRVETNDVLKDLKAYGEHPYVDDALLHAAEDFAAGGRPYEEVYGPKARRHYLTGTTTPNSELDAWVRCGNTFVATFENGEFVFVLKGYARQEIPEEILEAAYKGKKTIWGARGFTFEIKPSRMPNGEPSAIIDVQDIPHGKTRLQAYNYHVTKTGKAATFKEAMKLALVATPVEVQDNE